MIIANRFSNIEGFPRRHLPMNKIIHERLKETGIVQQNDNDGGRFQQIKNVENVLKNTQNDPTITTRQIARIDSLWRVIKGNSLNPYHLLMVQADDYSR